MQLFPDKTGLYPAYMGLVNAVLFSQCGLRFIAVLNVLDIAISQSAVPVIKAIVMPSFFSSISVIFCLCANSQMRRVYTGRVIATVHYYLALWYSALKKLIRIPMRPNPFFSWKQQYSVPVSIFSASPKPAIFSFPYARLKNVRWAKNWIILQTAVSSAFHVTPSAQFPANGVSFFAKNADNFYSGLIAHRTSI